MAMGYEGVGLSSLQKKCSKIRRTDIAGTTSNSIKEPPQLGIRDILTEMARKEIRKKTNSWTLTSSNASSKPKVSDEEMNKKNDGNGKDAPNFHDFDYYRTEKSFAENQVWAAYDDDDGMPGYYATIHSVISSKPLKMRMSWLNSKSNPELAPLNWIGSGFYKTSGEFWIGKYGVNRNWSCNWNTLTPNEVIHKYDTVVVLEDYNDQNDVAVAPLVKVQGFKTVFCKHSRPSKTWVIPREELFCFSHQVPSYLLTGQEGHKSCKGCFELDPAATPLELLQVLTEAQVKEMESMIERAWEDASLVDSKRSEGKELVENVQEMKPNFIDQGVRQNIMKEEIKKEMENKKLRLLVYVRRRQRKNRIARETVLV
ncbi:hypothetical protein V6N13_096489 [Hibiscus sabdariffa]